MEQQVDTSTNGVTPPADPDAAKYEALRKELDGTSTNEAETGQETQQVVEKPTETIVDQQRAKPEHVPYGEHENVQKALREARDEAKQSREQLSRLMQIVQDARGKREPEPAKKEEPPKLPDVQEDPIGHFTGRIAQLEAQLQEAHKGVQHTTEEQRAYQQQQAIWARAQASEAEIRDPKHASHKADYDEAVQYLENVRWKQLQRMYPDSSLHVQQIAAQYGVTPEQYRVHMLNQDRQAVTVQALQLGVPPAQFYYQLAEDMGWQGKPNGQQRAPNGQFTSLADKAKQQLEAAKKGKAASISISGGSGERKGAQDMSTADLADLFVEDPEMADKIWEEMRRAGRLG